MTLKVIHRLQAFSNAIRRTFLQHFTRFQLTVCSHGSSALAELLVLVITLGHKLTTINSMHMLLKCALFLADSTTDIASLYASYGLFHHILKQSTISPCLKNLLQTKTNSLTRKCGSYSDLLPLKAARRHSISNLTSFGASYLSWRRTQCRFI